MTKYTGMLAQHKTTGTVSVRGDKITGRLKVYGVNGVFIRQSEAGHAMDFTGPVKRAGTTTEESLQVYISATIELHKTPTGVNLTIQVSNKADLEEQKRIMDIISGK